MLMRIAVIGSGSLGLLWGSRLTQTLYDVTIVTRTRSQQEQLQEEGLCCFQLDGSVINQQVQACSMEEIDQQSPFDIIFITVKQTHLQSVMPMVQVCSHPFTQIVFWQNGLGQEEAIACLQHRPDTYVAITTEGAYRKGPTCVRHTGRGETWVGTFPHQAEIKPLLKGLLMELQLTFGLPIHCSQSIRRRMWEKLAVNAVINPLTAILQVSNGALIQPHLDTLIEKITMETCQVSQAKGVFLDPEKTLDRIREVCSLTAENQSSMLQDIKRGIPTEIESINGAIIRYASEHKIPVHTHELLYSLVKVKEETSVNEKGGL